MLNGKKSKKIIKIGIVAIITVIIIFEFMPGANEDKQQPPVTSFELKKMDITENISTSGKVESIESKNVSAVTEGKIKTVSVKLGQQVKKGDILARLDTSNIEREIQKLSRTSQTEINSTLHEMELKKREYDNANFLYSMGDISQEDLNKAQYAYETALADYETKIQSVDLSNLQQQLADAILKAPIDGTVTWINATEGANSNGILFIIEDTQNLKVVANVSEYDINQVKIGQSTKIKTEMTNEIELEGKVISVAPAAQKENTTGKTATNGKVQFQVEVAINDKNPDIKIGTNARVNIVTAGKEAVMAVPFDALVKSKQGNSIYIADKEGDNYIVKQIKVRTGLQNDFYVEIKGEELKEGLIVLNNPKELNVGQEVELG